MSDVKHQSFDGSPPDRSWPRLEGHALPSMTPVEQWRMTRQVLARLHAPLAPRGAPEGAAAAPPTPSTASPLARVEEQRQASEESATVRSPTFDERALAAPPAEAFVASPPAASFVTPPLALQVVPSPPVNAGEAGRLTSRPPEHLMITMLALPIPAEVREQLGRLPFKAPTPENELARTKPVPVFNPRLGETKPLGDDFMAKAGAALPFVSPSGGAGDAAFPRLSLREYASLRAELSRWPARSDEIRARYHMTSKAAERALEEHWQAELAASPAAQAMFEKDLADYTAWLRAPRA
jgi:hypothetical protein